MAAPVWNVAADLPTPTTMREVAARLVENGYLPTPVAPEKKAPVLKNWPNLPALTVAELLEYPQHGVGLLLGKGALHIVAIDIDVRDPELADELSAWLDRELGESPERTGRAPKRLRLHRIAAPMSKITSQLFIDEKGQEHRVEILACGQQAVVFGVHPDTHQPYAGPAARR